LSQKIWQRYDQIRKRGAKRRVENEANLQKPQLYNQLEGTFRSFLMNINTGIARRYFARI